ncbi:MAG TPA: hypothetical protein VFF29_07605 [Bacteroidota bacterium]|nr:hypothetical protein [Bacteroidota bacterium]
MKGWTLAAIVTGIIIFPLIVRKNKPNLLPIHTDPNKRYDIEEYLSDQEL